MTDAGAREWVEIATVARHMGVSRWAVQRWIQSGRVTARRTPSGRWRISRAEVERLQLTIRTNRE